MRLIRGALLLLLAGPLAACSSNGPDLPVVEVVTVVVEPTTGPTQTPIYITELQTVVVTATPEPEATRTARPTRPTRTPRSSPTVAVTEAAPASPTATVRATQPGVPATVTVRPFPTNTPRPAQPTLKYGPPGLEIPTTQESFGSGVQPLLRWQPIPLAENEYYEVTIERLWQNQPYYSGGDWVKEPQLLVPSFVRGTSDTNQYTWWVTVKRLTGTNSAGGKVGEAISPPSEQRTFIWSPE